jgi:hypothetical protein
LKLPLGASPNVSTATMAAVSGAMNRVICISKRLQPQSLNTPWSGLFPCHADAGRTAAALQVTKASALLAPSFSDHRR